MATLDPGISLPDLEIAAGDFNRLQTLLSASVDVATPELALQDFFNGQDVVVDFSLGELVVSNQLLFAGMLLVDSDITLQAATQSTALSLDISQAIGVASCDVALAVDGVIFNRRLNVVQDTVLVPPLDIVIAADIAIDSVTYYLRGYNATTEQFEFWSSVGVADVSGAVHLQAVRIIGITD